VRWTAIVPALALVFSLGPAMPAAPAVPEIPAAPQYHVVQTDPQVSLAISVWATSTPYVGMFMTIRFQARNNHTQSLLMSISARLPAGLTKTSSYPDCPTFPNNCALSYLNPGDFIPPGAIANLDVTVRVDRVINATVSGTVSGRSRCVPALAAGPFGRSKTAAAQCFPVYSNVSNVSFSTFASPIVLTIGVAPQPGRVGGDRITVTYTIRNIDDSAMISTTLTPGLPAGWVSASGCAPPPQPCAVGTIPRGGTTTRAYTLSPGTPGVTPINATVTATFDSCGDGCFRSATASAVSQVVIEAAQPQPVLTVTPGIGSPGFVTTAVGTGFPDGATVRLVWTDPTGRPLLTENLVLTVAGGGFTTQVLIFKRDQLGERTLHAQWVSGPQFNPVTTTFLVVPNTWVPPLPIRG
jgi:hypothetical protein